MGRPAFGDGAGEPYQRPIWGPADHRASRLWPYRGRVGANSGVVFDMDGILVDSEPLWVRARKDLVRVAGGYWIAEADTAMMGIVRPVVGLYARPPRPGAPGPGPDPGRSPRPDG